MPGATRVPPDADDDAELALADKVTQLAEASIAKSDSAEMELYAGLGYASRARLLGLRYEKIPVARAGVEARKHLLRCLELDPKWRMPTWGLDFTTIMWTRFRPWPRFCAFSWEFREETNA